MLCVRAPIETYFISEHENPAVIRKKMFVKKGPKEVIWVKVPHRMKTQVKKIINLAHDVGDANDISSASWQNPQFVGGSSLQQCWTTLEISGQIDDAQDFE